MLIKLKRQVFLIKIFFILFYIYFQFSIFSIIF